MTKVNDAPPAPEPEAPSRREAAKRDKLERITAAAEALFLERGYDATTTQEVAERAGIAKGTVFLYARTKPELLALVFRGRIAETLERAFARVTGPRRPRTLHASWLAIFSELFALYARTPGLARLFLKELWFADGELLETRRSVDTAFISRLASLVDEARERGEVAEDADAMLGAACAMQLYIGALTAWLNGLFPDPDSALERLSRGLALLTRGLAAPTRSAASKKKVPSPRKERR